MREIHRAARTGDIAKLRELIEKGDPIDTVDRDGYSPLIHAAEQNHLEAVRVLLEAGANPNVMGILEFTPLACAVSHRNIDMIKLLIVHGVDVNLQNQGRGKLDQGLTPLIQAATGGFHEIGRLLLDAGANVESHAC